MPRKPKPKTTSYVKLGSTKIIVPEKMVGFDNRLRPHLYNTTTPIRHNIAIHNHIPAINIQVNPNSIRKISRVPFTSQYINYNKLENNLLIPAPPPPIARPPPPPPRIQQPPVPRIQPPAPAPRPPPPPPPPPAPRPPPPQIAPPAPRPPPPPSPLRVIPPPPPAVIIPRPLPPPLPAPIPPQPGIAPAIAPPARAPIPLETIMNATRTLQRFAKTASIKDTYRRLEAEDRRRKYNENVKRIAGGDLMDKVRSKILQNKAIEEVNLLKQQQQQQKQKELEDERNLSITQQIENIKKSASISILSAKIKRKLVEKTNKEEEEKKIKALSKIKKKYKESVLKGKSKPILNDYKETIKEINKEDLIETTKIEETIAVAENIIASNETKGIFSLFSSKPTVDKLKEIEDAKKDIKKGKEKLKVLKEKVKVKKDKAEKLLEKRLVIIKNDTDTNADLIRKEYALKLEEIYKRYKEEKEQKKLRMEQKLLTKKQKEEEDKKIKKELQEKRDKKIKDMEEQRKQKIVEQLEKKKQIDIDKKKVKEEVKIDTEQLQDKKDKAAERAAIKAYKEQERIDAFEREQDKKIYEESQLFAQREREREKQKQEKEQEKIVIKIDNIMGKINDLGEENALLFPDEDYDKIVDYYDKIKEQLEKLILLYDSHNKELEPEFKKEVYTFIATIKEQLKEQKEILDDFKSKQNQMAKTGKPRGRPKKDS